MCNNASTANFDHDNKGYILWCLINTYAIKQ